MNVFNEKLKLLKGNRVVTTWSGGLDSTVLVFFLLEELKCKVLPVFIKRGQTNYEEEKNSIQYFQNILSNEYKNLENPIEIECEIPPGYFKMNYHIGDGTHILRNSDIINQAIRLAACEKVDFIVTGSHIDEDVEDNSKAFYDVKNKEIEIGAPSKHITIIAPFLELKWGKSEIIKYANSIHIDISKTWSCYKDSEHHCGGCTTCVQRKEAFDKANITDSTIYLDEFRTTAKSN